MSQFDNGAIAELIAIANESDNYLAPGEILNRLRTRSGNIITGLKDAIIHVDSRIQCLGLSVLEEIGNDAIDLLPLMITALTDEERTVRLAAVTPVSNFGQLAHGGIEPLREWLSLKRDDFSRLVAAGHLPRIDASWHDSMLLIVLEYLKHQDNGIRCNAIRLLTGFNIEHNHIVETVRRYCDDHSIWARHAAAEILFEKMNDPFALIEVATDFVEQDDPFSKQFGCQILGEIGSFALSALYVLHQLTDDHDPATRSSAASAINSIVG